MTEMALIPSQDYENFCVSIRYCLNLPETQKITSGEAYGMLLSAFVEADKHRVAEDWLISGVGNMDEYVNDRVGTVRAHLFAGMKALKVVRFPNAATLYGYLFMGSSVEQAYFPKAKSLNDHAFRQTSSLLLADIGSPARIGSNTFRDATAINTIIIRKTDGIVALSATGSFSNSPFASGGTGGKIYVPGEMIESYKTATNWSVLYSYGTCEFLPLEGSEYE